MPMTSEKSSLNEFPLTFPKWGPKTKINNRHRCFRPLESPPSPPPLPPLDEYGMRHDRTRSSLSPDGDCDGFSRSESENRRRTVGYRPARRLCSFADITQAQRMSTPERQMEKEKLEEADGEGENKAEGVVVGVKVVAEAETAQKPWNLRPRRASTKAAIEIVACGGRSCGRWKNGELQEAQQMENLPKSRRLRGFADSGRAEMKEKRKLWIALSREEIEDDIYALTGSKPARRPRKRARNVQKHLDNVFPGVWLAGVSAEYYTSTMLQLRSR